MRSLLRFSLLLSLSVVDVYEKMVKVQIKIHKEPPDHKMLIKVGLCATSITCYTMYSRWRCAQHPQSIPGPRSTPITLYLSALSTRLRTLPTLNTLAPTLRPHHTHSAISISTSAPSQHTLSAVHAQRGWQVSNRSPSLRSTVKSQSACSHLAVDRLRRPLDHRHFCMLVRRDLCHDRPEICP